MGVSFLGEDREFRSPFAVTFIRTIRWVSQSRPGRVVKRYKKVLDGEFEAIDSFPWTFD